MFRDGSCKPLAMLVLALLLSAVLGAGSACGGRTSGEMTAVSTTAAVQIPVTESTSATVISSGAAPSDATAAESDPLVRKVLDQLREAARRTPFTVYFLGASCGDATIAGVMTGSTDPGGRTQMVDIVYRHDDSPGKLVVYVSQYEPVSRPDLKKPLSDWTFVREAKTMGHTDVIYRGGESAELLFYVAQRGSTEINLAGYSSKGYMTEEQLIDIAPLLVPAL